MLVSHGVSLPHGLPNASRWISQANATETVIDMRLPSGHFCTVPVGQPYTEKSPISLTVDVEESEGLLTWDNETLPVQLIPAPSFYQKHSRSGARMGSFSALHEKLLVLHPYMGCGFFAREGEACQYCQYDSMLNAEEPPLRDPLELVEVVHAALGEREIDTVYLYNGFSPGTDRGLRKLVPVISLLRRHLGHRQIALETVAPEDCSVIDDLYAAGLDIFVCNLEVFHANIFAEVCPGKERYGGQQAVWRALNHACSVFRPGSVVSHLIVGLEPLESTFAGMDALVAQGVVPLLQPLRPLPGTPLESHPAPSQQDLEAAMLYLYALLEKAPFPTHRLRHMGRVLSPMESRVLEGSEPTLRERWAVSPLGRRMGGWLDGLRRHLRSPFDAGNGQAVARDDRPMHLLLAVQATPFVVLGMLAAAASGLLIMGAPEGLSENGWRALVIFVVCLVLWVSQLLPLSVTSLLGMALLPLLGVMEPQAVFSLFGNPAIFFILGAFILAAGLMLTGVSEHAAMAMLERFGTNPRALLFSLLVLPAVMAAFMPEHAVAALFLPIVWQLVRSLGLRPGHAYAQGMFLAMAWGAIIGGVSTMLGGARAPLALALVNELTGSTFSFLQWSLAAFPVAVFMLLVAATVLARIPVGDIHIEDAKERIRQRRLELGALELRGRVMALLMGLTVFGWVSSGHAASLASIALISVVAMFALRLVDWQGIEQSVNWGVVLMYGGAIALGKALTETGAASWLAGVFLPEGIGGVALVALLAAVTLLLTEAVSNAAAVAILLPIAIPLGAAAGLDPVTVALVVGIVSGFAFMLPMGTPPNAMVIASGCVQPGVMFSRGMVLSISSWLLFLLSVLLWWPLAGLGV